MAIISQETWDKFSNEEKAKITHKYNGWSVDSRVGNILCEEYKQLFGEENLQPKPKIRTWEDVAIHKSEIWDEIHKVITTISGCSRIGNKLLNKLNATMQIQKLIELGYGGCISEEEWKDEELIKFVVKWSYKAKDFVYCGTSSTKNFIAFHTPGQREEFMSYPENVELVKQYYMMDK